MVKYMSNAYDPNKVLLSTGSLYHLPLENIFHISREAGFNGLELIFNEQPETTNIRLVRSLIEKYDFPIISAHIPMDQCAIFGHQAVNIIKKCISFCTEIGATKLVVHPWRKNYLDYSGQLESMLQALRRDTDIKIFIENLPRQIGDYHLKEDYFNPVILARKYKPICLDTSHFATTGLNFKSLVSIIVKDISHVHLSDSNLIPMSSTAFEDEHLLFGTGKLPLEWLLRKLNTSGYTGDFCMELRPKFFSDMDQQSIISALNEAVEKVKV